MTLIEKYSHKERRSARKTQAVIVFLKLDFDLPHIIFRNLVGYFVQSRPENDVFLKLNQYFSYVISDTNTKERSKNEKEYEINKERRRHCSSEKFSAGKKVQRDSHQNSACCSKRQGGGHTDGV